MKSAAHHDSPAGVAYGLAAYGIWGIMPLYFVLMRAVPPTEILAHRIVFSTIFLLAFLAACHRWREVGDSLRNPKLHRALALSAALVGVNWLIYIQAVNSGQTVETALGYFINPLLNVVFGAVFFRERLRPGQLFAILIAAAGVGCLILKVGQVPWIALTLATTFGIYGVIRKVTPVDGTLGLAVESIMLLPIAIGYLIFLGVFRQIEFTRHGSATLLFVVASGVVLTVPMIFFGQAARNLRLTTLGFLQYIAPSLQFVLAVTILGEPLNRDKLIGFIFVWLALAVYTADTLRALHAVRRAKRVEEPILSPT